MHKRKSTFNCNLKEEFAFLLQYGIDGATVMCIYCNASFSIAHGDRSDIFDHVDAKKHETCPAAKASLKTKAVLHIMQFNPTLVLGP